MEHHPGLCRIRARQEFQPDRQIYGPRRYPVRGGRGDPLSVAAGDLAAKGLSGQRAERSKRYLHANHHPLRRGAVAHALAFHAHIPLHLAEQFHLRAAQRRFFGDWGAVDPLVLPSRGDDDRIDAGLNLFEVEVGRDFPHGLQGQNEAQHGLSPTRKA